MSLLVTNVLFYSNMIIVPYNRNFKTTFEIVHMEYRKQETQPQREPLRTHQGWSKKDRVLVVLGNYKDRTGIVERFSSPYWLHIAIDQFWTRDEKGDSTILNACVRMQDCIRIPWPQDEKGNEHQRTSKVYELEVAPGWIGEI